MWTLLSDHAKRTGSSRWDRDTTRSSSRASTSNRSSSSKSGSNRSSKSSSNRSSKTDSNRSSKCETSSLDGADISASTTTSFRDEPLYQFYVEHPVDPARDDDGASMADVAMEQEVAEVDGGQVDQVELVDCNSAMQLVRGAGEQGRRTLWREVPAVLESGILEMLTREQLRLQEVMFEVIVSEASYLKSLHVLRDHFMLNSALQRHSTDEQRVIDVQEWKELFKDVAPVIQASERFLEALDGRWRESVVIYDICDIVQEHSDKYFGVYVTYCTNQIFQDRCLTRLKESRPRFLEALESLEADPVCRSQPLQSFLVLPVQRIMRLRLLVEALLKQIGANRSEDIYRNCRAALKSLQLVCERCNEKTKEIQRREETLLVINRLEFAEVKRLTLASQSRFLLRRSEVQRWTSADTDAPITSDRAVRWTSQSVWLFLFTDLLLLAKKKSTADDNYLVLDYCARNLTLVVNDLKLLPARLPENCENLVENVGLCLIKNCKGKVAEMIVSFQSGNEKTKFVNEILPEICPTSGKRYYVHGDYPLMECQHEYSAQRADELTLKESDIVKIHCKACDGWCLGERLQDGVRGWFPGNFARVTVSEHVQAKNLRQRHLVNIIAQRHIEEQKKEDQRKSTFFIK